MHATARYVLSKAYFSEDYDEWFRHVARWQPWAPYVAVGFLGAALLCVAWGLYFAAAVALVAGVGQLIEACCHKSRWLAARCGGRNEEGEVKFTFTDESIAIEGPFSSTQFHWEGMERIVITPNGLLLYPQKGAHYYIPDRALEPLSAKAEIAARVKI